MTELDNKATTLVQILVYKMFNELRVPIHVGIAACENIVKEAKDLVAEKESNKSIGFIRSNSIN